MKRTLVFSILLFGAASFAGPQWGTPLCLEIFGANKNIDGGYSADIITVRKPVKITANSKISAVRKAQILAFYNHQETTKITSVKEAIESFDDYQLMYSTIKHVPTGKMYNHIQGYRGDTDVSAIFTDGARAPIAFTGDRDCYQD